MEVRTQHIKVYSAEMLNFLDTNRLELITDLDSYMGRKFSIKNADGDFIVFGTHVSNRQNLVRTMSYGKHGVGLPLEIAFNEVEDYNRYILKSHDALGGYKLFIIDQFGNPVLDKLVKGCSLDFARKELESLRNL